MGTNPTCATCRWWDVTAGKQSGDGACRAFAPRVRYNEFGGCAFPITRSSEWCGEHALRAEAPVVGADFGAGSDGTVICVPTAEDFVAAGRGCGMSVTGDPKPGDSFTVGRTTWFYHPAKDTPDAPR